MVAVLRILLRRVALLVPLMLGIVLFVFLVMRFPILTDVNEIVKATRRNKPITWEDYEYLRDNMKLPISVGAQINTSGRAKANGQTIEDTTIYGVTANIGDMKSDGPAIGRFIVDTDNDHRSMVALVGADIAEKLFSGRDPIGKELDLDGIPYEIVGVAKANGTVLGQSQDNFVYLPIQTFLKHYSLHNRSISLSGLAAAMLSPIEHSVSSR